MYIVWMVPRPIGSIIQGYTNSALASLIEGFHITSILLVMWFNASKIYEIL